MTKGWREMVDILIGTAVIIAVCFAITALIYRSSDADCRERGGHTEWVYGRGAGWTCDGAKR